MFSKNFGRIFTWHLWIHLCCGIMVICYPLVAEGHEAFPSFIESGQLFTSDVRPVNLQSELQLGYGLQEKTGDVSWPICPLKENNAQFGENGLTEPDFRLMELIGLPVFFVSSSCEIMLDHDLKNESKGSSDYDALDKRNQVDVEAEKRNHELSFWLGVLLGIALGGLFAGIITIPRPARD
jgi:hypothetical protein